MKKNKDMKLHIILGLTIFCNVPVHAFSFADFTFSWPWSASEKKAEKPIVNLVSTIDIDRAINLGSTAVQRYEIYKRQRSGGYVYQGAKRYVKPKRKLVSDDVDGPYSNLDGLIGILTLQQKVLDHFGHDVAMYVDNAESMIQAIKENVAVILEAKRELQQRVVAIRNAVDAALVAGKPLYDQYKEMEIYGGSIEKVSNDFSAILSVLIVQEKALKLLKFPIVTYQRNNVHSMMEAIKLHHVFLVMRERDDQAVRAWEKAESQWQRAEKKRKTVYKKVLHQEILKRNSKAALRDLNEMKDGMQAEDEKIEDAMLGIYRARDKARKRLGRMWAFELELAKRHAKELIFARRDLKAIEKRLRVQEHHKLRMFKVGRIEGLRMTQAAIDQLKKDKQKAQEQIVKIEIPQSYAQHFVKVTGKLYQWITRVVKFAKKFDVERKKDHDRRLAKEASTLREIKENRDAYMQRLYGKPLPQVPKKTLSEPIKDPVVEPEVAAQEKLLEQMPATVEVVPAKIEKDSVQSVQAELVNDEIDFNDESEGPLQIDFIETDIIEEEEV